MRRASPFTVRGIWETGQRPGATSSLPVGDADVTVCRPSWGIAAMSPAQRGLVWGDLYPLTVFGEVTRSNKTGSREARSVCNILP